MNELNNSSKALILWLTTLAASILSGVLAWKIVDPESFLGGVVFVVMWGVLSKLAQLVIFGVATNKTQLEPLADLTDNSPQYVSHEDPFTQSRSEIGSLTRVERPTDKTLSHNYQTGKLGRITFGQSTMSDVKSIWGQPNSVERKWLKSYHAYDRGLTFIVTNDTTQTVIGIGVNYDFEPILCIDNDSDDDYETEVGERDQEGEFYTEESPAPIVFAEPMLLRAFMQYFPLMEGVNPNDVLKVISEDYAVFEYRNQDEYEGDKSLKLFARRNAVNSSNIALTPIEIIEITDVPSSLSRRIPS